MHPNHPQRRPIEIVPLGEPAGTAPGPVAPGGTTGAWPAPSVRSTAHPPVPAGEPPIALIDLTRAAPVPGHPGVHPPSDLSRAVGSLDTTEPLVPGTRRERLRDLLARERDDLEQGASAAAIQPPSAGPPFPLPGTARPGGSPAAPATATAPPAPDTPTGGRPGLRRVPKAVRPDAAGRPLAPDVAAAIARLGRRTPGAGDAPGTPGRERHDEIVPLEAPAAEATAVPLPVSEVIDLRERLARSASVSATPRCPACDHPGDLDLVDRVNGLARYGCGHCFRVWSRPLG
jgi:hypothetical protein